MQRLSLVELLAVTSIASFAVGALASFFLFFTVFSRAVKLAIRKRLERGRYDAEPIDRLSDTRAAARESMDFFPALIKAPILDSAGAVTADDDQAMNVFLVEISKLGATVLSQTFVPVGLPVMISCSERKLSFALRDAQVVNVKIGEHGLRIGLQFLKPLDIAV
ncbi:MAG: hypothetical protein WCG78_07805 [Candidatus Omnitrophota bacterium]